MKQILKRNVSDFFIRISVRARKRQVYILERFITLTTPSNSLLTYQTSLCLIFFSDRFRTIRFAQCYLCFILEIFLEFLYLLYLFTLVRKLEFQFHRYFIFMRIYFNFLIGCYVFLLNNYFMNWSVFFLFLKLNTNLEEVFLQTSVFDVLLSKTYVSYLK